MKRSDVSKPSYRRELKRGVALRLNKRSSKRGVALRLNRQSLKRGVICVNI